VAKVINLRVENILVITQAEASPNGESLVIGGKNGQGKSSFQTALKMALAGKEYVPAKQVHEGAESGSALITLDNGWTVEFTVLPDRKTRLVVRQENGMKSDSVNLLKSLFGDLSFDPGDFMALSDRDKVETLMRLCKLDFHSIDAERAEAYSIRTGVNRNAKQTELKLANMPHHADAPAEPLDPAELMTELAKIQDLARDVQNDRTKLETGKGQITDLEYQIGDIRSKIKNLQELHDRKEASLEIAKKEHETLSAKLNNVELPDPAPIKAQIADLKTINAKVDANKKRDAVKEELTGLVKESATLTKFIEQCDARKKQMLAEANLPLDELGFSDDGLTFRGIPFDQISESQQWDVATAIAFRKNPNSVVFMSRSGGLDRETRSKIIQRAAALGCQLFLEVVDDSEDVQILIDRGTVAEDRTIVDPSFEEVTP